MYSVSRDKGNTSLFQDLQQYEVTTLYPITAVTTQKSSVFTVTYQHVCFVCVWLT